MGDGPEREIDLSQIAGQKAEVKEPSKSHRRPDISQVEAQARIDQALVTNQTPTERVHSSLRIQKGADQDQKANLDLTMQNFDTAVSSGRLGQFEVLEAKGARGNRVLKLKDPQTGHSFLMQENGKKEVVNFWSPPGKTPIDRSVEVLLRLREGGIGKFSDQERSEITKAIEGLIGVDYSDKDRLGQMVAIRMKLDDLVTARGTAIWAYDQSRKKGTTEADKKKFEEEHKKEAAIYDPKDFAIVDKKTRLVTYTENYKIIANIPGVVEAIQALNNPDYYKDSSKAGDDKRKQYDAQIRDNIRVAVFAQNPEFHQLGPAMALDLAKKLMIVSGRAEQLGERKIPNMKAQETAQTFANFGKWLSDLGLGLITGK